MRRASHCDNEAGAALVTTVLILLVFLTLGAAALTFSALDLKASTNDYTGHQAYFLAEAGVQHALNSMNRIGIIDFQNDIVNCWSTCPSNPARTVWGTDPKPMPTPYAVMQYSVQVAADATNPTQKGTMTSTGVGTDNAKRVIKVWLKRGPGGGSPGAVYAASDAVGPQFSGNSFFIDGNDHDLNAKRASDGILKPGISTRGAGATKAFTDALKTGSQQDDVQGQGYVQGNPSTPSVMTTGGPGLADLNQIINDLLAKPHVNWNSNQVNGGTTLGTVASPQITYLTLDDTSIGNGSTANGHASGAGILIANGSITINGTFDFVGWIIVRGDTTINNHPNNDGTFELGSGNILGAIWTGDFNIKFGGNANVLYSDAAMQLANGTGGGGAVPGPMLITAWQEVY